MPCNISDSGAVFTQWPYISIQMAIWTKERHRMVWRQKHVATDSRFSLSLLALINRGRPTFQTTQLVWIEVLWACQNFGGSRLGSPAQAETSLLFVLELKKLSTSNNVDRTVVYSRSNGGSDCRRQREGCLIVHRFPSMENRWMYLQGNVS